MRLIVGITLLLVGVGTLSCRLEGSRRSAPPIQPTSAWVRTVDGWERPSGWFAPPSDPPSLHPLVVAAGQALVSVLALVAAEPTAK
jgi:hypothetical protein